MVTASAAARQSNTVTGPFNSPFNSPFSAAAGQVNTATSPLNTTAGQVNTPSGQIKTAKPGEPVERHLSDDEKFREWSLNADVADGIKRIKESGIKLTRPQESWVCVIQSLRPTELIPAGLFLNGPLWPQDNIGPELLWMNKPLSDRAAALIPSAVPFETGQKDQK